MRKNDLLDLVASMTPNEKKYCSEKLIKGSKNGLELQSLFQELSDSSEDKTIAYSKLSGPKLSKMKRGLRDKILQLMRQYHREQFEYWKSKERILDFHFLFQRGLYEQAKEVLNDLRGVAQKISDHLLLLEINYLSRLVERKTAKNVIPELIEESKQLLKYLEEENLAENTYDELFELVRHNRRTSKEQISSYVKPDQTLLGKEIPTSPQAQRRYLQCKYIYANIIGDKHTEWEYTVNALKWWEGNALYKETYKLVYIKELTNTIHACIGGERDPTEYIQMLEKVSTQNQFEKQFRHEFLDRCRIPHLIAKGNVALLKNLIPGVEKRMPHYSVKNYLVLAVNVAIFYFTHKDSLSCRKWLGKINTISPKTSDREDIQVFARMLMTITAYELKDIGSFDNDILKAERYLKSISSDNYIFEKKLIQIFNQLKQSKGGREDQNIFNSLGAILRGYKTQPGGQSPRGWIQYDLWVSRNLKF